jgi:hypothetical protein
MRLNIAVNHSFLMSVSQAGAGLLDIAESLSWRDAFAAAEMLEVAARKIFQNQIVKCRPIQVARRSVTETTDNVRMSDAVEGDCFVLKVLDQGAFKIVIQIVLEENIQGLDNNSVVGRIWRGENVARDVNLGVASAAELFDNVIPLVQPAVIERKLSHHQSNTILYGQRFVKHRQSASAQSNRMTLLVVINMNFGHINGVFYLAVLLIRM